MLLIVLVGVAEGVRSHTLPLMWGCGLSVVFMRGFVAHITSLTHRTAPGCSVPDRDERLDQGPVESGLISPCF
jgi:hypothetical protein